jgi:hypothetical protein
MSICEAGGAAMKPETETNPLTPAVIGVDIGKEVFHLVRSVSTGRSPSGGRSGDWVSKTRLRSCHRALLAWKPALARISSAEYSALGHEPRIIPAIYVKPFLPVPLAPAEVG